MNTTPLKGLEVAGTLTKYTPPTCVSLSGKVVEKLEKCEVDGPSPFGGRTKTIPNTRLEVELVTYFHPGRVETSDAIFEGTGGSIAGKLFIDISGTHPLADVRAGDEITFDISRR